MTIRARVQGFRALVAALVALHCAKAFLFLAGGRAPLKWDSAEYWGLAKDIAAGDWRAAAEAIHRPPGYPAFLALHQIACGRFAHQAAVATQLALVVLTALLVAWSAGKIARSRAAFAAALAVTLVWMEYSYLSLYLLADGLLCALVAATLCALVVWLEKPSIAWAACSGLLLGVAALVKPVAELAWLPLVAAFAWRCAQIHKGRWLGPFAVHTGALVLAFCAALAPWLLWQRALHGEAFLAKFAGRSLWMSAFQPEAADLDLPNTAAAQRVLAARPRDPRRTWGVYEALVARGASPSEADDLMLRVALDAVEAEPLRFGRSVLARWGGFWTTEKRHGYWRNNELLYDGTSPTANGFELPAVARWHERWIDRLRLDGAWQWGAPLCALAGLLALAREPRHRPLALALFGLIAYLSLAVAATILPLYRYRIPVDPLVVASAVAGAAVLLERQRSRSSPS